MATDCFRKASLFSVASPIPMPEISLVQRKFPFRPDNTVGYTPEELAELNRRYDAYVAKAYEDYVGCLEIARRHTGKKLRAFGRQGALEIIRGSTKKKKRRGTRASAYSCGHRSCEVSNSAPTPRIG